MEEGSRSLIGAGILKGNGKSFAPKKHATRQETAKATIVAIHQLENTSVIEQLHDGKVTASASQDLKALQEIPMTTSTPEYISCLIVLPIRGLYLRHFS